ncbi:PREDICTED: putative uncharacterized protein DDB_G0292438 [Dufourea novaeangliae]|uniref:putative uncharacterized protein DDB_G0292438 n=1 Tax=Dufourea novaeangliae TaxID=178035 RepID=UPI0007678213|nr:PREDICTED: putative uncharacterized protein DDB_G0292438 [Dufourea novaeangliae]
MFDKQSPSKEPPPPPIYLDDVIDIQTLTGFPEKAINKEDYKLRINNDQVVQGSQPKGNMPDPQCNTNGNHNNNPHIVKNVCRLDKLIEKDEEEKENQNQGREEKPFDEVMTEQLKSFETMSARMEHMLTEISNGREELEKKVEKEVGEVTKRIEGIETRWKIKEEGLMKKVEEMLRRVEKKEIEEKKGRGKRSLDGGSYGGGRKSFTERNKGEKRRRKNMRETGRRNRPKHTNKG